MKMSVKSAKISHLPPNAPCPNTPLKQDNIKNPPPYECCKRKPFYRTPCQRNAAKVNVERDYEMRNIAPYGNAIRMYEMRNIDPYGNTGTRLHYGDSPPTPPRCLVASETGFP